MKLVRIPASTDAARQETEPSAKKKPSERRCSGPENPWIGPRLPRPVSLCSHGAPVVVARALTVLSPRPLSSTPWQATSKAAHPLHLFRWRFLHDAGPGVSSRGGWWKFRRSATISSAVVLSPSAATAHEPHKPPQSVGLTLPASILAPLCSLISHPSHSQPNNCRHSGLS
ncbi:hypothetical protein BGZ61DRAFT_157394 [Ilyonectria robusta]|uniref:uncharacterized protein n=1 Tax=Ilyonectria robusta TaxID=1079257 RepID=UPI001E8D76DD|nr:uncharacterized protein BGZ61DRAFT_157394 [Ilyonectria robusta]KAH8733331.1 hypothetical protein BGZ61DRAFT_157394 [Ilyonectria robusta]